MAFTVYYVVGRSYIDVTVTLLVSNRDTDWEQKQWFEVVC
jgi:hypothetical protein